METKFYYSKSKFVQYIQCKKRLWLEKYRSEYKQEQTNQQQTINGNIVGEVAMGLFGEYTLVSNEENDLKEMGRRTNEELLKCTINICEAAFFYENNYCAVDLLHFNELTKTYEIYEVKSTTKVKDNYYYDCAYQYYVLTSCGLNVSKVCLVHLNNKYEKNGDIELDKLFIINDLTENSIKLAKEVQNHLLESNSILSSEEEIESPISSQCKEYGGCQFKNYCYKSTGLPNDGTSILDIYSFNYRVRNKLFSNGCKTFKDVVLANASLNAIQKRQIDYALNDIKNDYIDVARIEKFISDFKFPLLFLDFETAQMVIPKFDGTVPYQQLVFQYSLHIVNEDGSIEHKEFLGDGVNNPSYYLYKQLIIDLGNVGTIIAYNSSFEIGRIRELNKMTSFLSEEVLNELLNRFVDLADVFKKGYYYNKRMGGSFSIKSVLPALFPDEESLDYHSLEDIHKGDEASAFYLKLETSSEEERIRIRKNLLKYCSLDTFAMVKIYYKLLEAVGKIS